MTTEFRDIFSCEYDFIGFVNATGLKAPKVGQAYNDFRQFSYDYTKENGIGSLSECFEVWNERAEKRCEDEKNWQT